MWGGGGGGGGGGGIMNLFNMVPECVHKFICII